MEGKFDRCVHGFVVKSPIEIGEMSTRKGNWW
jgi:hypothetical protein